MPLKPPSTMAGAKTVNCNMIDHIKVYLKGFELFIFWLISIFILFKYVSYSNYQSTNDGVIIAFPIAHLLMYAEIILQVCILLYVFYLLEGIWTEILVRIIVGSSWNRIFKCLSYCVTIVPLILGIGELLVLSWMLKKQTYANIIFAQSICYWGVLVLMDALIFQMMFIWKKYKVEK